MFNRIASRTLAIAAVLFGAAALPASWNAMPQAQAASVMSGYYTTLSNNPSNRHPDVSRGIDGGVITGLVQSTLGPNGLPVVSTTAYAGPSGPITDVNPITRELLWWTPGRGGIVAFEKVQVDPLPLAFASNFFPDGQGNNSARFRAVHWQGYFSLAAPKLVSMSLSADDDAWLFINGQLFVDDGGVKAGGVKANSTTFGAGLHKVDLFFADRHRVQSAVAFSSSETLTSVIPVPGALPLLVSGLALLGWGARRRASRVPHSA